MAAYLLLVKFPQTFGKVFPLVLTTKRTRMTKPFSSHFQVRKSLRKTAESDVEYACPPTI